MCCRLGWLWTIKKASTLAVMQEMKAFIIFVNGQQSTDLVHALPGGSMKLKIEN